MSIAEKLQAIAENQQAVYDAGYAKGQAAGGEDILQYATNADYLFNAATFPDGYELTINIPNMTENANRLVRYAKGVKKVVLKGNTANNAIGLQYAFQNDSKGMLEIVDATEWGEGGLKPTYANNCFANNKLQSILGEIDMSVVVNVSSMFNSAESLMDVRFKANTIKKSLEFGQSYNLTADSVQSIVDGLADLTGQTTQTLTLHKNIALTDDQKATISGKNWTLVQ